MIASDALPRSTADINALRPLEGCDAYTFAHGEGELAADLAAEIEALANPRGAVLLQYEARGVRCHCLCVPREIADRVGDSYAGDLILDLSNVGLMVASYAFAAA